MDEGSGTYVSELLALSFFRVEVSTVNVYMSRSNEEAGI
jgi:hypothetical protein